jgi:hypothetical protein
MITSRVVLHLRALALIPLDKDTDVSANRGTRLEFAVNRSILTGTGTDTDMESGHGP